jgi:hypothetical protein
VAVPASGRNLTPKQRDGYLKLYDEVRDIFRDVVTSRSEMTLNHDPAEALRLLRLVKRRIPVLEECVSGLIGDF